jgi:hypothetical protein
MTDRAADFTIQDIASLDRFYEDDTELLVLERAPLSEETLAILAARPVGSRLLRVPAAGSRARLVDWLELDDPAPAEALAEVVEVFGDLVGVEEVGVRLAVETAPLCPRMHVDRVTSRACCTWVGPGTQWVHTRHVADRSRLGHGARGEDDARSGLLAPDVVLQEVPRFGVAFFKGEAWPGMAGRGVVHRSPPPHGARRVVWTLDALATS